MQHPPTRDAIRLSMSMRRGRGLGRHRQCLRLHGGRALVELDDVAEEPAPARVVTTGWCVGGRGERNEGGRGGERLLEEEARVDHLHHRALGAAGAPLSGPRGHPCQRPGRSAERELGASAVGVGRTRRRRARPMPSSGEPAPPARRAVLIGAPPGGAARGTRTGLRQTLTAGSSRPRKPTHTRKRSGLDGAESAGFKTVTRAKHRVSRYSVPGASAPGRQRRQRAAGLRPRFCKVASSAFAAARSHRCEDGRQLRRGCAAYRVRRTDRGAPEGVADGAQEGAVLLEHRERRQRLSGVSNFTFWGGGLAIVRSWRTRAPRSHQRSVPRAWGRGNT